MSHNDYETQVSHYMFGRDALAPNAMLEAAQRVGQRLVGADRHSPEPPRHPAEPLREKTSAERKAEPVHGGVLMYFPDALAAVARVSKAGNDKHNPGEPLHWSRNKSNDHAECVGRHLLTPGHVDPETGEAHRTHALWRLLAEVQLQEEKRLVAAGILPLSGVVTP